MIMKYGILFVELKEVVYQTKCDLQFIKEIIIGANYVERVTPSTI